MRRVSPRDPDIIDAEFRVLGRPHWTDWMVRFPDNRDRFAFVCSVIAPLAVLGGLVLDHLQVAILGAVALCTVGCLVSTQWKRYGLLGLVVMGLLSINGCSQERAAPEPQRAVLASEMGKTPKEVKASIREATKYRDPREGMKPKGIDILSGEVKAKDSKDASHEAR